MIGALTHRPALSMGPQEKVSTSSLAPTAPSQTFLQCLCGSHTHVSSSFLARPQVS